MASAEDEQLDPRVQVELEKLNTATDDINKLESKLEEANNVFRTTLTESTARLKGLAKKLGSCVEKSRPFYEAQELARSSQLECQRAAVQYQRANALHQAAKETIALAEERFVNCRHEHFQFDSAWQEMLNHATMKVMEAEAQKAASEREHLRRASAFTQAEQKVQQLQRGLRSSINKSLIYFEEKGNVTNQLESQKEHVQELQRAIAASKSAYAQSLRSLELISEEIHEQRRCRLPREPGVGAELTPPEVTDPISYTRNSAKSFTPLEEMTAKDEKYWETLRQKLEKLQVEEGRSSVEIEVVSVPESPMSRERTVTGSSCSSNPESEHCMEEEEVEDRIVTGESSLGSESDDAISPSREKVVALNMTPMSNSSGHGCDKAIIYSAKGECNDVHEVDMDLDLSNIESGFSMMQDERDTSESTSDDNISVLSVRTCTSSLATGDVNHFSPEISLNKDVTPSNLSYVEFSRTDDNEEDIEDCITEIHHEVKERGDGSSSPPPAMCQTSRRLSAIPE